MGGEEHDGPVYGLQSPIRATVPLARRASRVDTSARLGSSEQQMFNR